MNPCKHGHVDGVRHIPCPHCRIEYLEGRIVELEALSTAAPAPGGAETAGANVICQYEISELENV